MLDRAKKIRVRCTLNGAAATLEAYPMARLLDGFYRPLVALRQRGHGYAVSLVKAGVRLRGLDVGPVRPPLPEPAAEHVQELAELIARGDMMTDTPAP